VATVPGGELTRINTVALRKGDIVRGGPGDAWLGRVTGHGTQSNVQLVWTDGPLQGRDARVPASLLTRAAKGLRGAPAEPPRGKTPEVRAGGGGVARSVEPSAGSAEVTRPGGPRDRICRDCDAPFEAPRRRGRPPVRCSDCLEARRIDDR
jgi:hypothetical protein